VVITTKVSKDNMQIKSATSHLCYLCTVKKPCIFI